MDHTPGPWIVRDKWYIGSESGDTGTHAEVKCCRGIPPGSEQHEANARLIAAAPDLLEACKALPDFDLESPDAADFVDHSSSFARAMILAREAIAKATNA